MIPGDYPLPVVLLWLFIFGSVVGSFLNVCIYRIPQQEKLWDQLRGLNHPPSSCPYCKKRILAIDNIPILGWLLIRGRCRFCRHSIPIRYALIEFFNGLLWVVLYVAIVPAGFTARIESSALYSSVGALSQTELSQPMQVWLVNAEYVYFLILAEALLVATFIDFDLMIIPDGVTIPGAIIGVIGATILGAPTLWPVWLFAPNELNEVRPYLPSSLRWLIELPDRIPWLHAHPHWHGFLSSVSGLVIGGGTVWIIRIIGQWAIRREAMGFGDVVLMAMIGSFLGWQPSLIVFFAIGPFCALVAMAVTFTLRFSREFPYGPYLSFGAMLVVLFWRPYFSKFERYFSLGPALPVLFIVMSILLVILLLLVRGIRKCLGIRDDIEQIDEWTSGDQLAFYANKSERENSAPKQPTDWPGISSGQGRSFTDRWRRGR